MRHLTSIFFIIIFFVLISCKKNNVLFNADSTYYAFTDARDGQIYRCIKIGNKIWMAENLRYNPSLYYNQNETIICEYGRMYTSRKNYCPEGWHIPSLIEWQLLINYLGGKEVAAGKLKESGNNHWKKPNTDASNSSGFTALPAGYSNYQEGLKERTETAEFWSSTENPDEENNTSSNSFGYISLSYNSNYVSIEYSSDDDEQYEARSIRCIKDD